METCVNGCMEICVNGCMETCGNGCMEISCRDSSGRVPYLVSKDKSVRDSYRRFMGRWLDLYDYSQTQIPSPLTVDMERERREKVRNNHTLM